LKQLSAALEMVDCIRIKMLLLLVTKHLVWI